MSPTMSMATPSASYTPTTDAMDRHEYGVTKSRKAASTGGGRAWSEDEEVYLLQTRLQKMPYKHIAAHLKKTELACRLHYHQLSHGSNRRKRTTSVSSGSSTGGHSPTLAATVPSPIREHDNATPSRSVSPPGSAGSPYRPGTPVHLPAILGGFGGGRSSSSPRLPAILPKPANMSLALAGPVSAASTASPTSSRSSYPTPISDSHPHSAPLMPSCFPLTTPTTATAPAPLRLDCSALPPPAGIVPASAVDLARLGAVYSAHRASFWSAVAADYGAGASPLVLEQAWRGGYTAGSAGNSSAGAQQAAPLTPVASPEAASSCDSYGSHRGGLGSAMAMNMGLGLVGNANSGVIAAHQAQSQGQQSGDKTRISAILGIDANPRSPKEREMVRRLEEERIGVVTASA